MIGRLAIVGVGLLGGSVAKAVRAQGLAHEIVGIGRDVGRLHAALKDGTLDRVTTAIGDGVKDADLIVLGTPVGIIERQLPEVWQAAAPSAVITDVGSTKAAIVAAAQRLTTRRPLTFVGSHPMAGSEQSGYGVARADLFRGVNVIVTPTDATEPRAVKTVTAFWESLGAGRVLMLDPETHDRAVAAISHVPHLVACALVDAVERFDPTAFDVAARGFKDTTRIAAGDVDTWEAIFLANRTAVVQATAAAQAALADLARLIERNDRDGLRAALARIKARRERLP